MQKLFLFVHIYYLLLFSSAVAQKHQVFINNHQKLKNDYSTSRSSLTNWQCRVDCKEFISSSGLADFSKEEGPDASRKIVLKELYKRTVQANL